MFRTRPCADAKQLFLAAEEDLIAIIAETYREFISTDRVNFVRFHLRAYIKYAPDAELYNHPTGPTINSKELTVTSAADIRRIVREAAAFINEAKQGTWEPVEYGRMRIRGIRNLYRKPRPVSKRGVYVLMSPWDDDVGDDENDIFFQGMVGGVCFFCSSSIYLAKTSIYHMYTYTK